MAGGKMLLWMGLAARLAPLLLMTSALLVATRFVHHRVRNERLKIAAAIAVLAVGMFFIVPYAARMGLIVGIRYAVDDHDWAVTASRIEQYEFWRGHLDGSLLYARGLARANEGHVAEALPDFAAAARTNDPLISRTDAVFQTALCLYALHRDREARSVLLSLPDNLHSSGVRNYLLGRIAEKYGDPEAEAWFRRSLAVDPSFQPALYRLLRILSLRHDVNGAVAVVNAFRRTNPAEANAPYLTGMLEVIRHGEVLVDFDPFHVGV